ncbi:MAG: hypothetical protein RLP02_37120, partial [Coleofasciculus sp. C2-GNP5-27]
QDILVAEKSFDVQIFVDATVDPMADIERVAAQISALDLIITTSGTVAHLAGALGKEVWVMVPKIPEWRWGLTGETSLWYPQARIFRQTELNDWSGPVDDVANALRRKH